MDITAFNELLANRGYRSSYDPQHPTARDIREIDVLRDDTVVVTFATRTLRDMRRDEVLHAIEETERRQHGNAMVDRLSAVAARLANAAYQDGTKILAQVKIGPIRDLASMPFPCASVEADGYKDFRVIVFIAVEDRKQTEYLSVRVADGLYEALHCRGSFHYLFHGGSIYRTITYWIGAE